ncbi:MAG TPA: PAC2 family protein, partial [Geodermatophilus sp.]|nr:PAC2 family protein [Geodermatophilus sp.]
MAQRPEELVELLPEAEPFLAREAQVSAASERRGLVLVHDLAGEFDAAHSGALAGAHLLASLPHQVIARFDADSLVDYR